MIVLIDRFGAWTARATGFGYILYDPDGYEIGVYASLEEARQSAKEASERYAAWSEEHLDPLEPMSLEEYAQLEEPDSFGESEEPPFDLEAFLREHFDE